MDVYHLDSLDTLEARSGKPVTWNRTTPSGTVEIPHQTVVFELHLFVSNAIRKTALTASEYAKANISCI